MADSDFTYPRKFLEPVQAFNGRALEDYLRELGWTVITTSLHSENWDGGDSLVAVDTDATVGFYIDAVEGSAQFMGDVWLGGDLTLIDGGKIQSGPSATGIVIDGTTANYRTILFSSGYAPGSVIATDDTISISSPESTTDYVTAQLTLASANDDTPSAGSAEVRADSFILKELLSPGYGDTYLVAASTGLRIASGSIVVPAYSFIDDPNTGPYNPSADVYGISCGNSSKLTISADRMDVKSSYLGVPVKTTAGAPATTPVNGDLYVNTADNQVGCYADGAWRVLASW